MDTEFKDHWAIILGGSSGLGLATARKLARHGLHLCIVHRDLKSSLPVFEAAVNELRKEDVQVITYNKDALLDTTLSEVIQALPKRKVKVLIHSIAKGSMKRMLPEEGTSLSTEDLQITIQAMALSWYRWVRELIAQQRFSEGARSIAFTSEGSSRAWPGYAAVSAAKATLEALMRSMAVELAPLELTTNCIQAGTTRTPSFNVIPGSEALAEMALKRNPFKKLTTPEAIADVVYLLCRDEARWINGAVIKADGGESIR